MQTRNPAFKEYVQLKIQRNEFIRALGLEITKIDEGKVEGVLEFKKMHEQQNGFFHGGVIASLCDMACGYAAYTAVEDKQQVFTADLKVSYLRKAQGKRLIAEG